MKVLHQDIDLYGLEGEEHDELAALCTCYLACASFFGQHSFERADQSEGSFDFGIKFAHRETR